MTVVAWDGAVLAADKQASNGVTRAAVTKVYKVNGCLLGVTGDFSVGMDMIEWFKRGANAEDFPASNKDPKEGCSLVVIRPGPEVWKYESGPNPFRYDQRFMAFGSGDESALVAMECGKSAHDAVLITQKYNTTCGLGVDAITF